MTLSKVSLGWAQGRAVPLASRQLALPALSRGAVGEKEKPVTVRIEHHSGSPACVCHMTPVAWDNKVYNDLPRRARKEEKQLCIQLSP